MTRINDAAKTLTGICYPTCRNPTRASTDLVIGDMAFLGTQNTDSAAGKTA